MAEQHKLLSKERTGSGKSLLLVRKWTTATETDNNLSLGAVEQAVFLHFVAQCGPGNA